MAMYVRFEESVDGNETSGELGPYDEVRVYAGEVVGLVYDISFAPMKVSKAVEQLAARQPNDDGIWIYQETRYRTVSVFAKSNSV